MGLALAAELNGYPALACSNSPTSSIFGRSTAACNACSFNEGRGDAAGSKLIEQEADLDKQFADRTVTPESLRATTAAVAATQGMLRETHLKYHLSTGSILTPSQMTKYAELRGYGGGHKHKHHH